MSDLSDVLVVIPCLNEAVNLPRLLDDFMRDTPGAMIVVADGGSTDGSRALVERYAAEHAHVRLLDNPGKLQSIGVNRAVAAFGSGKRWLVRVDAHCFYPPNYVAGLLEAARITGADAVVVPMRSVAHGCFQRAAATAQNSRLGTGGSPHRHVGRGAWVDHGHHALFGMARYRRLGGYDEGFATNEDAEFDHRQTVDGASIWLEPTLALDYLPRSSPYSLARQYFRYGRGRSRTLMLHRMPIKPRQLLPAAITGVAALAPLGLIWWPLALPAAGWAAASLSYGLALGVRARSACAGLSGVAAMIMHVAWGMGFARQRLRPR